MLLPIACTSGVDRQQDRPSGLGTMAYEVESFEIDGVDIAVLLAWAETTASPDRTYTL
jgi:hypothetical protein